MGMMSWGTIITASQPFWTQVDGEIVPALISSDQVPSPGNILESWGHPRKHHRIREEDPGGRYKDHGRRIPLKQGQPPHTS